MYKMADDLSHVTQLWRKLYVRHGESLVAYSIKDN